ncbi:MAG: hypothetical protein ABW036_02205, partial [Flavitalea sp.]
VKSDHIQVMIDSVSPSLLSFRQKAGTKILYTYHLAEKAANYSLMVNDQLYKTIKSSSTGTLTFELPAKAESVKLARK